LLRKFLPIAAAAALAGLVVGGVSGASSSEGPSGHNFTLIEVEDTFTFVDVDNSGDGPTVGDEFIFTNVLKNATKTETVGRDTVICTFTVVAPEADATARCEGTIKLFGRGTLEGSGLIKLSQSTFKIAINGGTGRYDEAQGQIVGRDLNDTDTELRFDID
jgi:hypothetical protein